MFGGSDFWLETRVIIKFRPILDIQEPLTDFHGDEAKKFFFEKKKTQNGRLGRLSDISSKMA